MKMENSEILDLIIEFGGGAEFLFGNVKKHKVQLVQENSSKWTIRRLLQWMEKNLLKERPELFIQDDSVRPGILVLINDADWELMVYSNMKKKTDILFKCVDLQTLSKGLNPTEQKCLCM